MGLTAEFASAVSLFMKCPATIAAAAASILIAGCATVPAPRIASSAAARHVAAAPYQWTLGNAPKAHKDMVARFGRVGLKPGQYLWSDAGAKGGESRVVVDRLTQMAYAYQGDVLVGAASVSTASKGRV